MANEALVTAVKAILAKGRAGTLDDSYVGYKELFSSPQFRAYEAADKRQALKLMVLAKGAPSKHTPAMIEAHRAALEPLTEMVSELGDPADYEMLGMCHVAVGNEEGAAAVFRAGLTIERERNPQSDLCGALMRRVAAL